VQRDASTVRMQAGELGHDRHVALGGRGPRKDETPGEAGGGAGQEILTKYNRPAGACKRRHARLLRV